MALPLSSTHTGLTFSRTHFASPLARLSRYGTKGVTGCQFSSMPTMPQMMPLAEIARTSAGLTPDLARHSRTPSRTLLTKQLASISAHPGRG